MKIEYIPKYSSLDINWLPNSILKGLILPQVYYVSDSGYGGAYYKVQEHDNDWGNLTRRPIILIDIQSETNTFASTIAHEFRHHWQIYNYGKPPNHPWNPKGKKYKKAIIDYFKGAWHEMDALCYEIKLAPTDVNLLWKEWILE